MNRTRVEEGNVRFSSATIKRSWFPERKLYILMGLKGIVPVAWICCLFKSMLKKAGIFTTRNGISNLQGSIRTSDLFLCRLLFWYRERDGPSCLWDKLKSFNPNSWRVMTGKTFKDDQLATSTLAIIIPQNLTTICRDFICLVHSGVSSPSVSVIVFLDITCPRYSTSSVEIPCGACD